MEKAPARSPKPASSSKPLPEESESPSGFDPIVDYLKANGLPVTLENYLALNLFGSEQRLGAESADTLPPALRDEWLRKTSPET